MPNPLDGGQLNTATRVSPNCQMTNLAHTAIIRVAHMFKARSKTMAQSPIQIGLPLDVGEPDAPTPQPHTERRTAIGRSNVAYIQTKSILTESSGFMSEYDYTLNPYSGCTFGCTYCYAAFFVRDQSKQDRSE